MIEEEWKIKSGDLRNVKKRATTYKILIIPL